MPLAADAICRQPERLRRALKHLRKDSSPGIVHKARTRTRRMEAMVDALSMDSRKNERSLVEALKPLRRKAGRVRDMDVLTRFASLPKLHDEEDCSIQLLEHLGAERERQARKLTNYVQDQYPKMQRRLKKCAALLDKTLHGEPNSRSKRWAGRGTAFALQLEAELRDWPALNRTNLHPFRLKVKRLRYVLQMAKGEDSFVESLGQVKDAIGEWHDWQQLSEIANELIPHSGCKLRREIDTNAQRRFNRALSVANQLRQQYLQRNPHAPRRLSTARSALALAA
jgi:CHAD domain-containing protein